MEELKKAEKQQGLILTQEQRIAALLPNSSRAINCARWLDDYFLFHGDAVPNSDGEIHLEPVDKCTIFDEYVAEISDRTDEEDPLSFSQFHHLWSLCYPNVKIREYKAVTGKCFACAKCSEIRRNFKSASARQLVKQLHGFHRTAYMMERTEYYNRRDEAKANPRTHFSIITDGFAQNHSILPWLGNQVNHYCPHILSSSTNDSLTTCSNRPNQVVSLSRKCLAPWYTGTVSRYIGPSKMLSTGRILIFTAFFHNWKSGESIMT